MERADQLIPISAVQPAPAPLDFAAVRERLSGARGREYWRSLEELADTEAFQEYLQREFPVQAPRDMAPLSRRDFIKVMGAGLALAGVGGCAYQPAEKIVPYVEQPEALVPGKPLYFATAFQRGGYSIGVLGESHMGRPVKIEGNPEHPASLGATDIFTQASLLTLYDPDRSQAVRHMGDSVTWDAFLGEVTGPLEAQRAKRGAGIRVLTETVTSPTLAAQLQAFLKRYPEAKLCIHEPVGRGNVREGAVLAFGRPVNPIYHFDRAERVLSLDANFLADEPGCVRYARDFSSRRRVRAADKKMNRLYVVESFPTITGATAEHRLAVRPSQVEAVARAIAGKVGAGGGGEPGSRPAEATDRPSPRSEAGGGVPAEWIEAVVQDLLSNRGTSLVIAGITQPPAVHALAHAINAALGNLGKTVTFTESVEASFGTRQGTLADLCGDLEGGRVEMLFIFDSNPVYSAPADLGFTQSLQKAPLRVHLGLYDDETAAQCHWHIPESHYLEAWSDARAYDGTASIVQPLIVPLYSTRSAHEVMAVLLGQGDRPGYDIVREYWRKRLATPAFDKMWHDALIKGVVPNTAAKPVTLAVKPKPSGRPPAAGATAASAEAGGTEISFRPDPTIWDGRYANSGWLQELPKPASSLTWDNAAFLSPKMAAEQSLQNGDLLDLKLGDRVLRAAAWVVPGHPDDSVTVTLGYGRGRAGKLGTGTGFNAYTLRTTAAPWFAAGLEMTKAGGKHQLAGAQHHFSIQGRHLVREGTLEEYAKSRGSTDRPERPEFMGEQDPQEEKQSVFTEEWPSDNAGLGDGTKQHIGYNGKPIPAWGMVIDLTACIGCGACTLACQAENNIPTVGKDQVVMNREMHWIRIDTYYRVNGRDAPKDTQDRDSFRGLLKEDLGSLTSNLETVFQPVPCMHCEKAPCEPVCPVSATSHSAEGINEMTYNRCIGTRYCTNNCPYKVRRFNYLQYSPQQTPTIALMKNPDVTVRSRGVMEKCTYCIQRITEARIEAEKEDRPITDGDVITACQQVCPTEAILFGNLNDTESNGGKGSRVRQLKMEPLNYALLTELNTRPRTSYLAKLRNPNPVLATRAAAPAGTGGEQH